MGKLPITYQYLIWPKLPLLNPIHNKSFQKRGIEQSKKSKNSL